jgi:RNA ligase (TIGR02306 family)
MSKHEVCVVRLEKIEDHPNADKLSLVEVYGWKVGIRKGEYANDSLAVYIPPDYCVPVSRPEFAFLAPRSKDGVMCRITAMKFRGIISFGLVVPAPDWAKEGDDVMEKLGIVRYEPPMRACMGGDLTRPPVGDAPKFDVENLQRYPVLVDGEEVVATEKIHGCNARYVFANGEMHCGSRTMWYRSDSGSVWSETLKLYPCIESWCRAHPGVVLYGEIYGTTQDLRYGSPNRHCFAAFAAFDRSNSTWMDHDDLYRSCSLHSAPTAPVVYRGPFDKKRLEEIAEQDSVVSSVQQLSEGVVVVPVKERLDVEIGRVCLKLVSFRYLSR